MLQNMESTHSKSKSCIQAPGMESLSLSLSERMALVPLSFFCQGMALVPLLLQMVVARLWCSNAAFWWRSVLQVELAALLQLEVCSCKAVAPGSLCSETSSSPGRRCDFCQPDIPKV